MKQLTVDQEVKELLSLAGQPVDEGTDDKEKKYHLDPVAVLDKAIEKADQDEFHSKKLSENTEAENKIRCQLARDGTPTTFNQLCRELGMVKKYYDQDDLAKMGIPKIAFHIKSGEIITGVV